MTHSCLINIRFWLEWQTGQVILVLLIQELLEPVFIGLEVYLTGNIALFCLSNPFEVKTWLETGSKTAFLAVFDTHIGL